MREIGNFLIWVCVYSNQDSEFGNYQLVSFYRCLCYYGIVVIIDEQMMMLLWCVLFLLPKGSDFYCYVISVDSGALIARVSVDDLMGCGLVFRFLEENLMNVSVWLTLILCIVFIANVFVLVDCFAAFMLIGR
jgi:low affinity Fe/Cu permease